jgi:hypothetical protein
MLFTLALILASQSSAASTPQDETVITAPFVALDLFKNGEAVVTRELQLSGDGTYVLHEDLEHRHGTLRVDAAGELTLMRTTRAQPVDSGPATPPTGFDLRAAMIDQPVVIQLLENGGQITGVLRSAPASITGYWQVQQQRQAWDRRDAYAQALTVEPPVYRDSNYLVVETPGGLQLISLTQVSSLQVQESTLEAHPVPETLTHVEAPAVVFTASGFGSAPGTARISYLTTGITWAPSYSADLISDTELEFVQYATVRNELVDLVHAELRLVTGVPIMKCRSVDSPFSSHTPLPTFFDQLIEAERNDYWRWSPRREARFMSQSASLHTAPNFSAIASSLAFATEDLQYRSIGQLQLRAGDSVFLELERERTEYEELVEVRVEPRGNDITWRTRQTEQEAEPRAKAWNVVRFKNPFDAATSTGPITVSRAGNFSSQVELPWTGRGAVTHLRASRALTIEAVSDEWEIVRERKPRDQSLGYGSTSYAGSLRLTNGRSEPARIRAAIEYFGQFHSASSEHGAQPLARHVPNSHWMLNPHTELTWELELGPGETALLDYEYEFKTR